MSRKATAVEIKKFFDVESTPAFMGEWNGLSVDEKAYFRDAVGEGMGLEERGEGDGDG